MRLLAISIVILAGAIMAAAGTLAEAMPDARRWSIVDEWGLGVVALGGLLLIAELFDWRPLTTTTSQHRADAGIDA